MILKREDVNDCQSWTQQSAVRQGTTGRVACPGSWGASRHQTSQLQRSASRSANRCRCGGSPPCLRMTGIFSESSSFGGTGSAKPGASWTPGSGTKAAFAGASRASAPERQWHSRAGVGTDSGFWVAAFWQHEWISGAGSEASAAEQQRKTGLVRKTRSSRVNNRAVMGGRRVKLSEGSIGGSIPGIKHFPCLPTVAACHEW